MAAAASRPGGPERPPDPGSETAQPGEAPGTAWTPPEGRRFFGHPRGLATLFFAEAWERFSYYGMKAILLYYMYGRVSEGGLGIAPATAASLVAVYGAAIYLAAIGGGWVSDRLLGARRATLWGGVLIMLGHVCLALPAGTTALYASMVLIVAGTGLLKPNVSSSVGRLYGPRDVRRDSGFSIYYMGISVGAVLAPLVVGTLGQRYDYHLGFGVAALGMAAGLLVYVRGMRHLSPADLRPDNPLRAGDLRPAAKAGACAGAAALVLAVAVGTLTGFLTADRVVNLISLLAVALPVAYFTVMLRSPRTTALERRRVRAYIPLFTGSVFFWLIQEQGASVLAQYADQSTDLDALGFSLPSSWFQSTGSFVLIVLTPFFAAMWVRLGSRAPSTPVKFGVGLVLAGLSYVLLVIPASQPGLSSPLWLFASFAVITAGEIFLSPIGLSVTTKLAPAAFTTQMMGLWLASNAAAQGVSAQVVRLYDRDGAAVYFAAVGGAGLAAGLLLLAGARFIRTRMGGADVRAGSGGGPSGEPAGGDGGAPVPAGPATAPERPVGE